MTKTTEALSPFMHHDVALTHDSRVVGYMDLELVLAAAYHQASSGKGAERHANDDDFTDQPIMTIGRLMKSPDGEAYQAIKKCREGLMMHRRGNSDACIRELLGAINYLAAVALLVAEERATRLTQEGVETGPEPQKDIVMVLDTAKTPNYYEFQNWDSVQCPRFGEIISAAQFYAALRRHVMSDSSSSPLNDAELVALAHDAAKFHSATHLKTSRTPPANYRLATEAIAKWRYQEFK